MITFDVRFDLDGLTENVAVMADKVQRKAALELFGELLQTTPIDTGRARAGWGMDARQGSEVPPEKKKPAGWEMGMTPLYPMPPLKVPPKGASFIMVYNNVEYIVPLNEGTTTRPARRFVQAALDKVQRNLS